MPLPAELAAANHPVHLRLTPSLQSRPWVRPALALCGFGFVLVAYVGTSFLFGRSSHAF